MTVRVLHYLNQFFAGLGGEERAGLSPGRLDGPAGPGRLLAASLGEAGRVVATLYCGDNHFAEQADAALAHLARLVRPGEADVLVAGPAFDAGRYGTACARVGRLAAEVWGLPAVAGLHPDNPGVGLARPKVFVVPTGASAAGLAAAMPRLARLALKLGAGVPPGWPEEEGYLPRGVRRNYFHERNAAERAVEAVLVRLAGRPSATEIPLPRYDRVPPPPPVPALAGARLALVSEAGVVPRGNPDGLESARATRWFRYPLSGVEDMTAEGYQTVHAGYDNAAVNADPDRAVPVDALRACESAGELGRLHEELYVTTGMATAISESERMGREIALDLRARGVDAVLLTAT